jgi:uncharacterized membrane protein
MAHLTIDGTVRAPASRVFGYATAYGNIPKYLDAVTAFEPAGDRTEGVGAVFRTLVSAAGQRLGSRVEITTWEPGRAVGWTAVKGFQYSAAIRLEPAGEHTRVVLDFDYQLAGGLAGKLLVRAAEPAIKATIARSVHQLATQVEALPTQG